MALSAKIREQIISSFRSELVEHVQTMNDGLLALEQQKVSGKEREETLAPVFRAAHSLKGAARAVGVSAVEQLAHELEDVLGSMQRNAIESSPALYTACYKAIDAIQAVQAAYEAGETTPPTQSLLALAELDAFRSKPEAVKPKEEPPKQEPLPPEPAEISTHPAAAVEEKSQPAPASKKNGDLASITPPAPTDQVEKQEAVKAPEPAPAQPQPQPQQPTPVQPSPAADETIRVSVSKLDSLMAQLSELLASKIRAEQRLVQIRQAQTFLSLWQKEWLAERGTYSRLVRFDYGKDDSISFTRQRKELSSLLEYVDSSQNRLREINSLISSLAREYNSDTMQMSLIIDGLEEEIKRVRMLPLATITGSFGRMVRDLAQASGKEAVLEIVGGDVELDKRVLEQIKDPIIHMLRNAVDHGIESVQKRLAAGKPAAGKITLAAEHQGKDVSISVSDDGNGLDIAAIRKLAIRRSIPNASTLTELELVDLIYTPGFSTSPIITDVSGRGVGLDVVRRNVETLRGRINVDWKPGVGARFTLSIPLTLTSSRGLLVSVSDQMFAIPLNAIERIIYVKLEDVESVGGHDILRYDGRPLMLVHLGSVLKLPKMDKATPDSLPVVILSAAERRMAFAVDELADEQEVVIKGLGKQLPRVGGVAGASVMGNGEVILILNVADLIKLALRVEQYSVLDKRTGQEAQPALKEHPKRRILVVDDSITTRTLEKNILEAAGYIVQLAMDGLEAYNAVITGENPDIIISDVSMPKLDGFGLAQRIKTNERTNNIPVILVTSLDSPEDKARGIESGAEAYIVKSSFDQNNLLETIQQLI